MIGTNNHSCNINQNDHNNRFGHSHAALINHMTLAVDNQPAE